MYVCHRLQPHRVSDILFLPSPFPDSTRAISAAMKYTGSKVMTVGNIYPSTVSYIDNENARRRKLLISGPSLVQLAFHTACSAALGNEAIHTYRTPSSSPRQHVIARCIEPVSSSNPSDDQAEQLSSLTCSAGIESIVLESHKIPSRDKL